MSEKVLPPGPPTETPFNEEHSEAIQSSLDKKRYAYVASLTTEEQEKFKKMEEAVVTLKGLGIPFFLLAAPDAKGISFWQYQTMSAEPLPHSDEEMRMVYNRAFAAYAMHSLHYCKVFGDSVILNNTKGIPFGMVNSDGYIKLGSTPPPNV